MYYPKPPSVENQFLKPHALLMNQSFLQLLGYPLLDVPTEQFAQAIFEAPFVLLSHNTQQPALFNYANLKALELFELNWQELIQLPSSASAEVVNQKAREKLLKKVSEQGFIKDYQGIRISSTGKRFSIKEAIVWNLIDKNGIYQGQAACFSKWQFL